MAKLTDDQRVFIVKALACFDTPSDVVAQVRDEFGIELTRQQIHGYDPTRALGNRQMAEKWKVLFERTRKAFLEDTSDIPISHKSTRIRRMNRMAERAENQGNMVLAASLMEQAAKEMGGSFTNRRELTGADGAPIRTEVATVDMSKLSEGALEEIVNASTIEEPEE